MIDNFLPNHYVREPYKTVYKAFLPRIALSIITYPKILNSIDEQICAIEKLLTLPLFLLSLSLLFSGLAITAPKPAIMATAVS